MLRWYDYVMVSIFAYLISQGGFLWAILAWVCFVQYMHQRRDGHV
jgi:hypothetical protein